MRYKHPFILLVAGILVLPNLSWSQMGGGFKKSDIAADPDGFFNKLSGGKDTIVVAELSSMQQMMLKATASKLGAELGERMTREQFKDHVNKLAAGVQSGTISLGHKDKGGNGEGGAIGAPAAGWPDVTLDKCTG